MSARAAPQGRPWPVLRFISSLLLIGASGYLIINILQNHFAVNEVSLPDVVSQPLSTATQELESLGFTVKTYTQVAAGAPVDSVIAQSPEAGSVVREGRVITLGVNASGDIEVPLLIGSTQDQAKTILNALGLELGEVSYTFGDIPQGQVISQLPEQTSKVALNTKVSVVISRGPGVATVAVPDVRGLNIEVAKQRLRSLGFSNLDTVPSSISNDAPQTVTQQTPSSGESVPASTRITLGYSLSSSIVVQVPSLVGSTLQNAQALLQGAGLTLGPVSYVSLPDQPGGVTTYAPSGYTLMGAPVMVEFNGYEPIPTPSTPSIVLNPVPQAESAPAPPAPSPTPAPEAPVSDGSRDLPFSFEPAIIGISALMERSYNLRLEVEDDQGLRELFNRAVPAGEAVKATYKVYGQAQVKIYINDILYQAFGF